MSDTYVNVGPENILDIVNAYTEDFTPSWADASRQYASHFVAKFLFKEGRVKRRSAGTEKVTFTFKTKGNPTARFSRLFDKLSMERHDLSAKGEVNWTNHDCHFLIDSREPNFNGHKMLREIFDHIEMQKQGMVDAWAEHFENTLLALPTPTSGAPAPLGIPYWVTPSTEADFDFNGLNPTGYTSKGGLDVELEENKGLRNGTFTLNALSDSDGIPKLEQAIQMCNFAAPLVVSQEHDYSDSDFVILTHPDWYFAYSKYVRTHNDNIGPDGGKFGGGRVAGQGHTYMGIPWYYSQAFSNPQSPAYDATKPIYGLNLDSIQTHIAGDWFRKQLKPTQQSEAPTVHVFPMYTQLQLICTSPRSNFRGRLAPTS